MAGVSENMTVGVNTEVISAEKMIVTAGAIDSHCALLLPCKPRASLTSLAPRSSLHLPAAVHRGPREWNCALFRLSSAVFANSWIDRRA